MIELVVSFFANDPQVAWLLTFGVLLGLSAIVMALHHAYKERKDRIAAARFHQCEEAFGMGGKVYRCNLPEDHEGIHAYDSRIMWTTPPRAPGRKSDSRRVG